jgi:hypothetical protein
VKRHPAGMASSALRTGARVVDLPTCERTRIAGKTGSQDVRGGPHGRKLNPYMALLFDLSRS